jgi:Lon-like protease
VLSRLPRPIGLALCALPIVALFAVVAFAPLPYVLAGPGTVTADVLGSYKKEQVITITKAPVRKTAGQLRMTTISATGPSVRVHIADVVRGWFRTDRAVMPRDAVYPAGQNTRQIEKTDNGEMEQSQNAAVAAALRYLHKAPGSVGIKLRLADVGGPSAGLLFTLGIIDKLAGDGSGGDLTGGRVIAGTGTIDSTGKVGAVGGVALKTQAAAHAGATVFVLPKGECGEAEAEPAGLRLVPVTTLNGAVAALEALKSGGKVPSC